MPNIIQDLKLKSDPSTIVNPNIVTDNIPSGAVTTAKIASNAVTAGKIASGAVTASKIENGAVQTSHISAGAVTEPKIDSGAITTAKIADGAVTGTKIADNTIDGATKVIDATINLAKLLRKVWNKSQFTSLCPTFADFMTFITGLKPDEVCGLKFFLRLSSGVFESVHFCFKASSPSYFVYSYFDDGSGQWIKTTISNDSDYSTYLIPFIEYVILYVE